MLCRVTCTGIACAAENALTFRQLPEELQPLVLSGLCVCWSASLVVSVLLKYREVLIWYISEQDDVVVALWY